MSASIVIRTLDEERFLGDTLAMIARQTIPAGEVIVVDSGSTDRTVQIARDAGARIIEIPRASFTYGGALNTGAAAAGGEWLVNLSAHAVPLAETWLEALLAAAREATGAGHRVAGVFGRQVPMPDAGPLEARDTRDCYGLEGRISADDPFFSNSNALVLRALWARAPFDATLPYSEDMAWMAARQREGMVAVYAPDAAVYHSHGETPRQVLRRSRSEGLAHGMITGERWSPLVAAGAWIQEVRGDRRYFTRVGLGWTDSAWWTAPVHRAAKVLGGYLGRRAAARRRG